MAGGTFVTQNKVRPGVYINFVSENQEQSTVGTRGIAALGLPLSWGAPKQVVAIEQGQNIQAVLGYPLSAPQLRLVREALKRAQRVLVYRLNSGVKATATHEDLVVTALHSGVRGNDLSVAVRVNANDSDLFDVVTLLVGAEVDLQTVADIAQLQANEWVSFNASGDLTATAGITLSGGTDSAVAPIDHDDFLQEIELHDFHTIAYTGETQSVKESYVAFARRQREDEGKKIQVVLANYPDADYEGVISVKNGVKLADETVLTAAQATAWVAGATAGADVNQALTYTAYDHAVDVAPRYTNSQIATALQNGEWVFTPSEDRVIVEQDINTLTTFVPGVKSKAFSKNRVIRVLDNIGTEVKRLCETTYIGVASNNADGRAGLWSQVVGYLRALQELNAIQNFSADDVTVNQGQDADSVVIEASIQPVDSMEKIYMNVRVS